MGASSQGVPRQTDISDLPDVVVGDVLEVVSRRKGGLSHALVCRQWHSLATATVTLFQASCKSWVPSAVDVIREMEAFPNLTSVTITRARSLGDLFLRHLADTHPGLKSLRINLPSTKPPAPRNTLPPVTCHFTSQGWAPLLHTCTALTTLDLTGLSAPRSHSWLPPNLQGLSSLTSLKIALERGTLPRGFFLDATRLTSLEVQQDSDSPLPAATWDLVGLRVLRLTTSKWGRYEAISRLTRLHKLHLEETSDGDMLWRVGLRFLPQEVGSLTSLTSLYVESKELTSLPATLASLTNLSTLTLHTPRVPADVLTTLLASLPAVAVLDLWCSSTLLPLLSPDSQSSLQALTLRDLKETPEELETPRIELPGLKALDLEEVRGFPSPVDRLPQLTSLVVQHSPDCFPHFFGQLSSLKVLSVHDVFDLEHLPNSLGQLVSLQRLDLGGLRDLRTLPESVGQLSALTELKMRSCGVSTLPDSVGDLCSLQELHLEGLLFRRALPCRISQLQRLTTFTFRRMRSLIPLPDLPPSAPLAVLEIHDCNRIRHIPRSYWKLQHLRSLVIRGCRSMNGLFDDTRPLQSLHSLHLEELTSLAEFPESVSTLTGLRSVILDSVGISSLPQGLSCLTSLSHLQVRNCTLLKTLPPNLLQCLPMLDHESRETLTQLQDKLGREGAGTGGVCGQI